jgi:hypothetical protein
MKKTEIDPFHDWDDKPVKRGEREPGWVPNSKKDESPTLHIFDERAEKRYGIDPDNPPLDMRKFDIPKSRA